MAKADIVWMTLVNVQVRSAETFAEEVGFWDRITLNFEPGNSAEWDLVASGALTWDGKYAVRGDDENDVKGGKHAVSPINPVVAIHETQEVDLSKLTPPEFRISGSEDDDSSGDDTIHEIVVDVASLRAGGRSTGSTNNKGFHYVARVIVQPSRVGNLTHAPDLSGGSLTVDDPAMVFTKRYYARTPERQPAARGDGGLVEGLVVWNHGGTRVPVVDEHVRVFDLQQRELTTFEPALGGIGACHGAPTGDPALYAFRPRSQPELLAVFRDGEPAPFYLRLPETRVPGRPLPSRPAIAEADGELSVAFADPGSERVRVFRLGSYSALAAQADQFGIVDPTVLEQWEHPDSTQIAPALAYVGGTLWVAWSSNAAPGTPGVVRVHEIGGGFDREVDVAGVPALSPFAPSISVFENSRVTAAWTDETGVVGIQDVIGPTPHFATQVTPKAGSAPSLALHDGRLYVAYAISDIPSFIHYEHVTTFNRTGTVSGSMSSSGGH